LTVLMPEWDDRQRQRALQAFTEELPEGHIAAPFTDRHLTGDARNISRLALRMRALNENQSARTAAL
jgi:hypothetical protein